MQPRPIQDLKSPTETKPEDSNSTSRITLDLENGTRHVNQGPRILRVRRVSIPLRTKLSNVGCALLCLMCAAALAYAGTVAGEAENERIINRTPEEEKHDANSVLPSDLVIATLVSFIAALCCLGGSVMSIRDYREEIVPEVKEEKDIGSPLPPADVEQESTGPKLNS